MDEASSKFVDQLAIEKIIKEKLGKVHHYTTKPWQALSAPIFDTFGMPLDAPKVLKENGSVVELATPMKWARHPENDSYSLHYYPAKHAYGVVLLVHGLYEESREMYGFFVGELNRQGLDVYISTLPFHHERLPKESRFGGEYFLSGDLERTKQAFCQAVLEVRCGIRFLSSRHGLPVFAVGFSMGGTVVLGAVGASDDVEKAVAVNPASNLFEVLLTSPLCTSIRADLQSSGLDEHGVQSIVASFDPFMMPRLKGRGCELLIYGIYDQINRERQYEALARKWGVAQVHRYKAGHLNTLRVPRFATDVARFCLAEEMERSAALSGGAA